MRRSRGGRLPAGAALLVLALVIAAVGAPQASAARASTPLATCFWEGPISMKQPTTRGFDGHYFNFPESSATYWLARLRLPEGARLVLRGRYAHARYQSLNAYSEGAPADALADVDMRPDRGSTNPFVARNRRDRRRRSYRLTVVDEPAPGDPSTRAPNTLYARPGPDEPIELLYRVYEPDRGRDLAGGTGLPAPSLVLADGSVRDGDAACAAANDPNREIPVQSNPAAAWQAVTQSPGCDPETSPAYDPPYWERFFTLEYAILGVTMDCNSGGRDARHGIPVEPKGGFYSNRDNAYVYAHTSRRFGPVLVLEGKLPTFVRTYSGQRRMGRGQVRFWSVCQNESRVTTRAVACLADRQLRLGPGRRYTIVVSRPEDRPGNATRRCGVGWLDWGPNGDAAGRPDYGLLVIRNMLPARGFAQAIQNVAKPGSEPAVMGDYFPRSTHTTKAQFEARGCRR